MNDQIAELKEDIQKKFDRLCLVQVQPSLFVAERFDDIRFEIDLDAEVIIEHFQSKLRKDEEEEQEQNKEQESSSESSDSDSDSDADPNSDSDAAPNSDPRKESPTDSINGLREGYLHILKIHEDSVLDSLSKNEQIGQRDFSALKQNVGEFMNRSSENTNLNEAENECVRLALALVDETRQLERQALGCQTIFYLKSKQEDAFGKLVHLTDEYFSPEEIEILKPQISHNSTRELKLVHQDLEIALNKTLLVGQNHPYVVTERTLLMSYLVKSLSALRSASTRIISFGTKDDNCVSYEFDGQKVVKKSTKNTFTPTYSVFGAIQLAGIDPENMKFDSFPDKNAFEVKDNQLKSLDKNLWPYITRTNKLDLSGNSLEYINEEELANCAHLESLCLTNACAPETRFNLNFIGCLFSLESLELTLPDGPVDLEPFIHLTSLKKLHLEGAATLDSNKSVQKLTKQSFKQLTTALNLKDLSLVCLELEAFDQEVLSTMDGIVAFRLSPMVNFQRDMLETSSLPDFLKDFPDSSIFQLGRKQFAPVLSFNNLEAVKLFNHGIEDLSPGIFDQLVNLEQLILIGNQIKHVKRGVFDKLTSLKELDFERNPIETIDDFAFKDLGKLKKLDLSHCQLKSINEHMFSGLVSLEVLILKYNQLETFQVNGIELSANISDEELAMVREKLFCDLKELTQLDLETNKFARIDLNCFINLKKLENLNLSTNIIEEINRQANEETLVSLECLNFNKNELKFVHKEAFSKCVNLEALGLQNNKIERLDDDFFAPFTNLKRLYAKNNQLEMTITKQTFPCTADRMRWFDFLNNPKLVVEKDTFEGQEIEQFGLSLTSGIIIPEVESFNFYKSTAEGLLGMLQIEENIDMFTKVKHLSLTAASIQTLHSFDIGRRFTNLVLLDLSENQLTSLEAAWFENLTKLATLDLSENKIEKLDNPDLFKGLSKSLTKLYLHENEIKEIHRDLFKSLVNLEYLDLSKNPAFSDFDMSLLRPLVRLETLGLRGNKLSRLDMHKLFQICPHLAHFDFSDNQLDNQSFNESSMSLAGGLVTMKLAQNRLENMDFVRNLVALQNINLSKNCITSLELTNGCNVLGRLTKLAALDLSGNQIRSFKSDAFAHFMDKKVTIDLSDNPLETKEMIEEAKLIGDRRLYTEIAIKDDDGAFNIAFKRKLPQQNGGD